MYIDDKIFSEKKKKNYIWLYAIYNRKNTKLQKLEYLRYAMYI